MITVEEALERILAQFSQLEAQEKTLLTSLGQVLAADVVADLNIPPHDNSAMDGYAVRAADVENASRERPVELTVIANLPAGQTFGDEVVSGTAVRIMTGAPIPRGADTVVQFEDTDEGLPDTDRTLKREKVLVFRLPGKGMNIRKAGEDIRDGETVLRAGTVIRPAEVGVLASLGYQSVMVTRRPWVAVVATGDELTAPGADLEAGKIYNSNSFSVSALVQKYGGIAATFDATRDNRDDLSSTLSRALGADLIITTGGVSTGDFDMVKDVLATEGEVGFWRVRMKPGKPIAFGNIQGVPLIGLPGNPVSAMITFEMFARPAIMKMLGYRHWAKPMLPARLLQSAYNRDGRRVFLRAYVEKDEQGEYTARLAGNQGSGVLTSMAGANGLAIVPEERSDMAVGETVQVMMLDWPSDPLLT